MRSAITDTIYFNGNVVTVDKGFAIQQAFAVQGDTFTAVGTNDQVKTLASHATRLVDLKGQTVIPGMSDNHDHLFNASRYMWRGVDMIGVTSKAEAESRLRKAVREAKPRDVVFTTIGWAISPMPNRKDPDAISADIPMVMIGSRRAVGSVFNSAALKLAGITKENPTFTGMLVPQDASGEFTGAGPGFPAAVELLRRVLPPMSPAEEEAVIIRGWQERNALGITSIRELSVYPETIHAYYRLWRQGKLTGRVGVGIEYPDQANTPEHLARTGLGVPFGDEWMWIDSTGEEPWTPGSI
ncbi:MAG: amidohydrolase family protein, partial [Syntrophaceae bacterium]|nr:amidohydrolase family protein [Syntrophaceae bacterium]